VIFALMLYILNHWAKKIGFWSSIIAIAMILISCHHPNQNQLPLVTIKLSGWESSPIEEKILTQMLQNFEVEHSRIKVKYEVIAEQYMDILKTRLIGEAAPDVFYLDALASQFFISQKILEPLDKYIQPEFDLQDFPEKLLNIFRYKNHIYGLPKDYSTLGLFYNKKSFQAKGLNSPPITWNQLLSYSSKLTDNFPKQEKYGFGESPDLSAQICKIKAFGGNIWDKQGRVLFDSPANLQGLQLSIDQYQKYHSSALKSDLGVSSTSEMFGEGKVAMVVDGNWAIPYLQETFPDLDFAISELPRINGRQCTMVFTVAYVINHQTKHKAEAWELISYLTGKPGMLKWAKTGFALPTRKSVMQKLGYVRDELRLPLIKGTDYAIPWRIGKYPDVVINSFQNQFISALLGEQTLKQAMLKAEKSANRKIEFME